MRCRRSPYSTEYLLRQAVLAAKRHDDLKKNISAKQESDLAQQKQILADRQKVHDSNHHKMKIANEAVGFAHSISIMDKETKAQEIDQAV
jgi:hypothetical protein